MCMGKARKNAGQTSSKKEAGAATGDGVVSTWLSKAATLAGGIVSLCTALWLIWQSAATGIELGNGYIRYAISPPAILGNSDFLCRDSLRIRSMTGLAVSSLVTYAEPGADREVPTFILRASQPDSLIACCFANGESTCSSQVNIAKGTISVVPKVPNNGLAHFDVLAAGDVGLTLENEATLPAGVVRFDKSENLGIALRRVWTVLFAVLLLVFVVIGLWLWGYHWKRKSLAGSS